MATSHVFNNKRYKLPGVYATTKADITPAAVVADYGRVLLIDTGSNAGWGAGQASTLYRIQSASDFRNIVKGGPLYPLGTALFEPSNIRDTAGVSEVLFISAKSVVNGKMSLQAILTETPTPLDLNCKNLGSWANTEFVDVVTKEVLKKGYQMKIEREAGSELTHPWHRFSLYESQYTGINSLDGMPYNSIYAENITSNRLITISPKITSFEQFFDWLKTDVIMSDLFEVSSETEAQIIALGNTNNKFNVSGIGVDEDCLVTGCSETYTPEVLDEVLSQIQNVNANFVLCDQKLLHANNLKIQYWASNESRFPIAVVIPGGDSKAEFADTIAAAKTFNNDLTRVVYNGIKSLLNNVNGQARLHSSLVHAGYLLGREAGLTPQVPMTFKEINISGLISPISENDKEDCLDNGIMTTYYDDDIERYVCLKGINTLQNNTQLVNQDGSTHSTQCRRIADYVNREMIIDAKRDLFTQRNGVTIVTLTEKFLRDWVEVKLKQKVNRELIAAYLPESISVVREQDAYFVSYKFRPSYEINFIFMTGFMIN